MIHAYQETYVNKAQSILGEAFDYAINTCGISPDSFIKMFLISSISKKIEKGDPKYIKGKSGIEVALDIICEVKKEEFFVEPTINFIRTKEYWIGHVIAYYQWYSDKSFSNIFEAVTYNDLVIMYNTIHEADISKFVEIMDERIKDKFPETNLKRMRLLAGYSQLELAIKSGVKLRSIQMYEQRNKDINKASVETIYKLSKTLNCEIIDLIER